MRRSADQFARNRVHNDLNPAKTNTYKPPKTHTRSERCEFFTDDYILKQVDRRVTSPDFSREGCYSERSKTRTVDCSDVWYKSFSEFPALNWFDLFLSAFVPLLLAWLIALIVILAARWIWAGYTRRN